MGLQFSRCLDEPLCGQEPSVTKVKSPSDKTVGSIVKVLIKPNPDEEQQVDQQFDITLETKTLPKHGLEDEKPTWTADSIEISPALGERYSSETSSNQSVISTISPTKDISKKTLSLRSPKSPAPCFSPIRGDSWLQLEPAVFNLTPIEVNRPWKALSLQQPYMSEIISIHDIKNAILFNDLEALQSCPSKEYMFTKYHFRDFRSQQALHLAVLSNKPTMVQYILSFSPKFDVIDEDGHTPLDLAKRIDNPEIIELLEQHSKNTILPQPKVEVDSPVSPFPESSVISSSYQESIDEGIAKVEVMRAMSDFSIRRNSFTLTPQHSQSDLTEQESHTFSNSSAQKVPPYKRIFPKRVRKAAKQFIHFMGR